MWQGLKLLHVFHSGRVLMTSQSEAENKCHLATTGAWHIWRGADTLHCWLALGGRESDFTAHKPSEVTASAWLMGPGVMYQRDWTSQDTQLASQANSSNPVGALKTWMCVKTISPPPGQWAHWSQLDFGQLNQAISLSIGDIWVMSANISVSYLSMTSHSELFIWKSAVM